jgi:hypothetical protein
MGGAATLSHAYANEATRLVPVKNAPIGTIEALHGAPLPRVDAAAVDGAIELVVGRAGGVGGGADNLGVYNATRDALREVIGRNYGLIAAALRESAAAEGARPDVLVLGGGGSNLRLPPLFAEGLALAFLPHAAAAPRILSAAWRPRESQDPRVFTTTMRALGAGGEVGGEASAAAEGPLEGAAADTADAAGAGGAPAGDGAPAPPFPLVLAVPAVEREGLARTGDPLNPDGDLALMGLLRGGASNDEGEADARGGAAAAGGAGPDPAAPSGLLAPGGLLLLAIPVGKDHIDWNARRI